MSSARILRAEHSELRVVSFVSYNKKILCLCKLSSSETDFVFTENINGRLFKFMADLHKIQTTLVVRRPCIICIPDLHLYSMSSNYSQRCWWPSHIIDLSFLFYLHYQLGYRAITKSDQCPFKKKAPFGLIDRKFIIPHTKIGPVVTACRFVTSQILWKVFWTDAECWAFGHVVTVSSQTTFCLSGRMKLRNPRSQSPSRLTYLCTRIAARAL